jgi:hypothetical protein
MNNMMRSATNGTINRNAMNIIKHFLKLHHEHHHEEPLVVLQETMQKMVKEKEKKENARKQDAKLHDEQITTMQKKKHKMNEKVKQHSNNV